MQPLDDIKVLDLSRVLAGPWSTMTLGDLGADVWKIEHPVDGDDTRGWLPPDAGGESTYYLSANRNKKSVALDLKSSDGQAIVQALAVKADILVENMRIGTLDKLGLGYDDLSVLNPKLIYASISGYGRASPLAERAGYDFVIQAESGLMSITGAPDGAPMKHGMAITDLITGMSCTQSILAALIARGKTGRGQYLDIALYDSAVALLANIASSWLNAGLVPVRHGNAHATIVPYELFASRDGHFVLAAGNDLQFRNLCNQVLGVPGLASDPLYVRNRDRVVNRDTLLPILKAHFQTLPTATWIERLDAAGVPAGIVRDLPAVFAAAETLERGLVETMPHPTAGSIKMPASPLRLSDTPVRAPVAPPLLGQHTHAVLRDVLGMTDAEIARLMAAKIVRGLHA
jgi:crotonobetainyl-CoA:carnitine CoA-transferase CaiB-like acyl-CoA transferase